MRSQMSNRIVLGILFLPVITWFVIILINAAVATQGFTATPSISISILDAIYQWNPSIQEALAEANISFGNILIFVGITILIISAIFALVVLPFIEKNRLFRSKQAEAILSIIIVLFVILSTKSPWFGTILVLISTYGTIFAFLSFVVVTGILILLLGRGSNVAVRTAFSGIAAVKRGTKEIIEENRKLEQEYKKLERDIYEEFEDELEELGIENKLDNIQVKNIDELIRLTNTLIDFLNKHKGNLNNLQIRARVDELINKIINKGKELHKEIMKTLKISQRIEVSINNKNKNINIEFHNFLQHLYILRNEIRNLENKYKDSNELKNLHNKIDNYIKRLEGDIARENKEIKDLNALSAKIHELSKALEHYDKTVIEDLEHLIENQKIIKTSTAPSHRIIKDLIHLQKTLIIMKSILEKLNHYREEYKDIIREIVKTMHEIEKDENELNSILQRMKIKIQT